MFSDLKPYMCTAESCSDELRHFPSQNLWEIHEFSEHRSIKSWHCPFCNQYYKNPKDLEKHLPWMHKDRVHSRQIPKLISNAEKQTPLPTEVQVCPLCKVVPGKSQHDFITHVGKHMETIALIVFPTITEDDLDESSIDTSIQSQVTASRESLQSHIFEESCLSSLAQLQSYQSNNTSWSLNDLSFIESPVPQAFVSSEPSIGLKYVRSTSSILHEDNQEEKSRCPNPDCGRVVRDLKSHMLTHQHERPHKCPIANCEHHRKGFARKHNMRHHELTHYKGAIICEFCPGSGSGSDAEKSFNCVDDLKRHLTAVHGVKQSTTPSNNWKRQSFQSKKITSTSQISKEKSVKCLNCTLRLGTPQDFYEHLNQCITHAILQENGCDATNKELSGTVKKKNDNRNTAKSG